MASLIVGQTIRVKGPKGAFVYEPNMVRHFGMIAGGTGITPMLQIIRAIVRGRAAGDKTEVDLIFANVTAQDILLKEDLDALAKEDDKIRIHYVLDNPPQNWTGGVGYVTGDMITVSCSSIPTGAELLLTPPQAMAPQACRRYQDPYLRSSTNGPWPEEDYRVPRIQQVPSSQQAPRSSLCFLRKQVRSLAHPTKITQREPCLLVVRTRH